jgi:hypothetical protein
VPYATHVSLFAGETPTSLIGKRAVVNVQNFDNECFRWAILSALYPVSRHANRVSQYARYVSEVNWDGLRFPVTLAQIRLFERNNCNLTINVYVYQEETGDVIPVYLTKYGVRMKHIDLLLLKNDNASHYLWIKNMSALVCNRTRHQKKVFVHTVFTRFQMSKHSTVISLTARNTNVRELFYLMKTKTSCVGNR